MFKLALIVCLVVASSALPTQSVEGEADVRSISASASGSFNVSIHKPSPPKFTKLQQLLETIRNATTPTSPTIVVQTVSLESLAEAYRNKTVAASQALSDLINKIPTPPPITLPSITLPPPPNITALLVSIRDKANNTVQTIVDALPSPPSLADIQAALANLVPTLPSAASISVLVPKPNVASVPSAISNITSASLSALANVSSAIGANLNSVLTPTTGYNLSVSVNKDKTGQGKATSRVAGTQLAVESREEVQQVPAEEQPQEIGTAQIQSQAEGDNDERGLKKPLLLLGTAAALSTLNLTALLSSIPGLSIGITVPARSDLEANQPVYYQPYPGYPDFKEEAGVAELAGDERKLIKPLIVIAGASALANLAAASTTSSTSNSALTTLVNSFSNLPSLQAGITIPGGSVSSTTSTTSSDLSTLLSTLGSLPSISSGITIPGGSVSASASATAGTTRSGLTAPAKSAFYYRPYAAPYATPYAAPYAAPYSQFSYHVRQPFYYYY